jgi:hypothetical protein
MSTKKHKNKVKHNPDHQPALVALSCWCFNSEEPSTTAAPKGVQVTETASAKITQDSCWQFGQGPD